MAEIESELKARKDFPSNLTTPKNCSPNFLNERQRVLAVKQVFASLILPISW
jgi:hypothetical protein